MRNFRDLTIWKDSISFTTDVYKLVKMFPSHEKFGLTSQLTRCAVSIPSNIAEGCKGSNKELINYLNISLGSTFELETQLIISHNIGFIDEKAFQKINNRLKPLQKSINAFRTSIKRAL